MNTISITKDDAKKFRLPKKAIANWIIEKVESDFVTLHRQKEDGTLASNFPKNTYKLFADVFDEIYKASGAETFPKIETVRSLFSPRPTKFRISMTRRSESLQRFMIGWN